MSDTFADVALPLALARPLRYGVSVDVAGHVAPGCRVVVPVQGREMVGIVTGLGGIPPAAGRVREIIAAPDAAPVLDRELLALARHLAGFYAAPPGFALRAMLPAALYSVGRPVVRLVPGGEGLAGAEAGAVGRSGSAAAALERLFRTPNRAVPLAQVRRAAGSAGLRAVHRLVEAGAAELVTLPPRTAAPERRERVF